MGSLPMTLVSVKPTKRHSTSRAAKPNCSIIRNYVECKRRLALDRFRQFECRTGIWWGEKKLGLSPLKKERKVKKERKKGRINSKRDIKNTSNKIDLL